MVKIRFTLNQVGMMLEQYKNGRWIGASPLFKPEQHGGVDSLKSKILMLITQPYELVLPGEYRDDTGQTVLCV